MKTATYAGMHFVVAFIVAYALTGSLVAAVSIGLVEPFIQTGAYALHEKLWESRGGNLPEIKEKDACFQAI
ncbi:MAG: DUF2061 domain-containing protein [Pseudomonadota bacterium]